MDIKLIEQINSVVDEYNGMKLEYGKYDCHTMIFKMFEPEIYEKLYGKYTSVLGGARVANKTFGYLFIEEFLEASDKYEEIDYVYSVAGDIIVQADNASRVCMLILPSRRAFCVTPKKVFGVCKINPPPTWRVFRRL